MCHNMAMADSVDPETTQFPPVRATPQAINLGDAGNKPSSPHRRGNGPMIALLSVLILIIVAAGVWLLLGLKGSESQTSALNSEASISETQPTLPADSSAEGASAGANATSPETAESTEATGRPAQPELPAEAMPANDAAASLADAGNLNNVYSGSVVTSAEFARAVRDAFVTHYLETDELSGEIQATSPVTGETYTLSCEDNGAYVTCSGGNNAIVYIS